MVYLTDNLGALLEQCDGQPIMPSEFISSKEVRRLFKLHKEINNLLCWARPFWGNCIETEEAAKEFSKILKPVLKLEILPNKDYKPKLEKSDVIIVLEDFRRKPRLLLFKVKDVYQRYI